MSLINDALKRAKAAQQQAPAPVSPGPQLRPVEAAQQVRHGVGILLPGALALVALAGLFLVWQLSRVQGSARTAPVNAQTVSADWSAPATARAPVAVEPAPDRAAQPNNPAAASTPLATANSATNPAPDHSAPAATAMAAPSAQTNATINAGVVAESVPPKPAPLKLQAIIFNPARPSALISGKTLFIGDRIGEFRLVALDRESVTLAGAGETKVLSLGP